MARVTHISTILERVRVVIRGVPGNYANELFNRLSGMDSVSYVLLDENGILALFEDPSFPDTTAVHKEIKKVIDLYGLEGQARWTIAPAWSVTISVQTFNPRELCDYLMQFVEAGQVESSRYVYGGIGTIYAHFQRKPTQATLSILTTQINSYKG